MAVQEDSRPFITLRQGAENFRANFDNNIESCAKTLDSKLSTLICDPDSFSSPSKDAQRLAANVEFSKAKFEIFMSMKALLEEMEESWLQQLSQLKENFLENIEILLASTKLETDSSKKGTKSSSSTKNSKTHFESRSSIASSVQPFSLLNTAKKIPVLNALLPKDERQSDLSQVKNTHSTNLINNIQVPHFSPPSVKTVNIVEQDDETSEEDNEVQILSLKQRNRPGRKSTLNTSLYKKESLGEKKEEISEDNEVPAATQERQRGRPAKKSVLNISLAEKEIPAKPLSRRTSALKETVIEEPVVSSPSRRKAKQNRKSILKTEENELHTTPSRSTRKRTAVKEVIQIDDEVENNENGSEVASAPKTPKNVHFSAGLDVHEDLEIYSPEFKITRSAPRRKTVVLDIPDSFSDVNLTPNVVRSKSKRKTIGGSVMDASAAPSPKRLKRGNRASLIPEIAEEPEEFGLLESDVMSATEHYTPWLLLNDLDGKTPAQPGVYELKVYKAKKPAYIGGCENLRQKLTLHKLGQSSGHKHLDKFLERNKNDVQVRYEKMSSAAEAKNEEKIRIKAFVDLHKTTPAYN